MTDEETPTGVSHLPRFQEHRRRALGAGRQLPRVESRRAWHAAFLEKEDGVQYAAVADNLGARSASARCATSARSRPCSRSGS